MILRCMKPNIKRIFNASISDQHLYFDENGCVEVEPEVGRAFAAVYSDLKIVEESRDRDFDDEEMIDG